MNLTLDISHCSPTSMLPLELLYQKPLYTIPFMILTPILFVVGVVGNVLNLMVLNSKRLYTKISLILSAMAAANLVHAIFYFVVNLHWYVNLIDNDEVRRIYHHVLKLPAVTLANWSSMTSTWLAVAATIERLIVIRTPFAALQLLKKRHLFACIGLIVTLSFVLTPMYNLWWTPTVRHMNVSSLTSNACYHFAVYEHRIEYKDAYYIMHAWRRTHAAFGTVLPVLALFLSNSMLFYYLRLSRVILARAAYCSRTVGAQSSCETAYGTSNVLASKTEKRIAVVVFSISLSAACFLLPSSALVVYDGVWRTRKHAPEWYYAAVDICNTLIMTEKVMDFFLYCVTSAYFRKRLAYVVSSGRRKSSNGRRMAAGRPDRTPYEFCTRRKFLIVVQTANSILHSTVCAFSLRSVRKRLRKLSNRLSISEPNNDVNDTPLKARGEIIELYAKIYSNNTQKILLSEKKERLLTN